MERTNKKCERAVVLHQPPISLCVIIICSSSSSSSNQHCRRYCITPAYFGSSAVVQDSITMATWLPGAGVEEITSSSQITSPAPSSTSWQFDVIQYKLVVNVYVVTTLCVFGILGNLLSVVVLGLDRSIRRTTGLRIDRSSTRPVQAQYWTGQSVVPRGYCFAPSEWPTSFIWSRACCSRQLRLSTRSPTGCRRPCDVCGRTSSRMSGLQHPLPRRAMYGWSLFSPQTVISPYVNLFMPLNTGKVFFFRFTHLLTCCPVQALPYSSDSNTIMTLFYV